MSTVVMPSLATIAKRLQGKVALITGGAAGIGECAARLFTIHGAKVVIADIQDDRGHALAEQLGGPAAATYVHCDVTDESNVRAAVDTAVAAYGHLDIMYNNAGTLDRPIPITEVSKADFERVLAVNTTGAFLGTKHAARVMVAAQRGGSIIFTASVASVLGGLGTSAYTCSKHAVLGWARSAAAELGKHGIRVNCISPAGVATELALRFLNGLSKEELESSAASTANLKGSVLRAEDIAAAALYLASDDAKYVSGHNLVVDGGLTVVKHLELNSRS